MTVPFTAFQFFRCFPSLITALVRTISRSESQLQIDLIITTFRKPSHICRFAGRISCRRAFRFSLISPDSFSCFRLLLAMPNPRLLSSIFSFHHLFDLPQILIFLACLSRIWIIAYWVRSTSSSSCCAPELSLRIGRLLV
jgi:hypothetical protein